MNTRTLLGTERRGASRWAWPLSSLAVVAVIAGAVLASGGEQQTLSPSGSGAGGDSVGTLPLTAGGPPQPGRNSAGQIDGYPGHQMPTGPDVPIFALVGTQAELDAVLFDAHGAGSINVVNLGNGLVRYEFLGRITIELRRAQFQSSFVSAEIVVGSSFHGAKAVLKVDHVFKAKQILTEGVRDLPLQQLMQSGVVDLGVNWHAKSTQGVHRVIAIDDQGSNLIRIDQRD